MSAHDIQTIEPEVMVRANCERDMDLVRDLLIFFAEKRGRAHVQAEDIKFRSKGGRCMTERIRKPD